MDLKMLTGRKLFLRSLLLLFFTSKVVSYNIFYTYIWRGVRGLIISSIHLILREDSHRSGTSSWKQEMPIGRRYCKKSQRLRWTLWRKQCGPLRLRRSRSVTHLTLYLRVTVSNCMYSVTVSVCIVWNVFVVVQPLCKYKLNYGTYIHRLWINTRRGALGSGIVHQTSRRTYEREPSHLCRLLH